MNKTGLLLIIGGLMALPTMAVANDFSTVTRVQYVQDCMNSNSNLSLYEGTYKCSCVVDKLAEVFTQQEYESIDAGFQFKNLPGDRGGVFRDDDGVMNGISLFKKTHAEAYASCHIKR